MRALMLGFLVLAMLATACGDDDDDAATATTTDADFDVVFDGEECTVTGPDSVPAGEYTFVLTDDSGLATDSAPVDLWVRQYLDGHTNQELIDLQEDEYGGPGGAVEIRPPWVVNTRVTYDAPELDLEENQKQSAYILESGAHGMNISVSAPERQWICIPAFEVT